MRKATLAVAPVAALAAALSVSACQKTHDDSALKAKATSSSAEQAKKTGENLIRPCIPSDQASLVLSKSARKTFATCLAIPRANRDAFYNCMLTAVEHTSHPTSKAARVSLLNDAFPQCDTKYRSKA
jgi:hypothetical protein